MAKRQPTARKAATKGRATARTPRRRAADVVVRQENEKLKRELAEALERQKATGDVLSIISRSPSNVMPVMDAIVQTARRLCQSDYALILERDAAGIYRIIAHSNARKEIFDWMQHNPVTAGDGSAVGIVAAERQAIHLHDSLADPRFTDFRRQKVSKARTMLGVPLLQDGEVIGVIFLARMEVHPFSERQIELVSNFAHQAVIAIENARLLDEIRHRNDELAEALEFQTATGKVLHIVASSPSDVQRVFDAMLEKAISLCAAKFGSLFLYDGNTFTLAADRNLPREYAQAVHGRSFSPEANTGFRRLVESKVTLHITDMFADASYARGEALRKAAVELGGVRSLLAVPLLKKGELIGNFSIYREDPGGFAENQIALVTTFADQAVIAIENSRLLKELRQRTDDLSESLQQQTATADVLKVITRSTFSLQTVLDALVESATRLCDAQDALIFLPSDNVYRAVARHGFTPEYHEYIGSNPIRIDRGSVVGRTVIDKQLVHVTDVLADPNYTRLDAQKIAGYRAVLGAPLLREGDVVGVIFLTRTKPQPFTEKQIELVKTFADQAIIAIENTRLLSELQQSLQQQTATADVLKAISRSAFDLETVLNALVEAAARLCEADQGTIARQHGDAFVRVASWGFSDQFNEMVRKVPVKEERGSATGRALLERRTIHIADVDEDPEYTFADAKNLGGFKTIIAVPMLREGVPIGVLALTRIEKKPFTSKQIELVETFSDQAAIAIENVRLFEQVQQRTRELSQSLDELRAAQDRLVQTEKLASLGQLTAGIAHEIKNPLNFVNNFSALSAELVDEMNDLLEGARLDDKRRGELDEIRRLLKSNLEKVVQHGKRADSIVKNMLLHSRSGSGEYQPVEINAVIDESLNLAYHGARAEKQGFNIALERDFDPAAGIAELYPQEITRVLLNLVSNGIYAATKRAAELGNGFEPKLRAATRNLGDKVEIRIRDNGTGIPPDIREKIFNPFFTTKPAGEGTGLGLSMSHDIVVKQHGGTIEVATETGTFTEFIITLPRTAPAQEMAGGTKT